MHTKRKAVLIDIDNTLVDTAVRKKGLLSKLLGMEIELSDVKKDFWLSKYLGSQESEVHKKYFTSLESEEVLREIPVPLIDKSVLDVISWLNKNEIKAIYISSRDSKLYDATKIELTSLGIEIGDDNLKLLSSFARNGNYEIDCELKKAEAIRYLLNEFTILALVGDRPSDVLAAKSNNIPSILIKTTVSEAEEAKLDKEFHNGDVVGFTKCNSWAEIGIAIDRYHLGQTGMMAMRDEFISQYASWLGEIDQKILITVTISSIITAASGSTLLEHKGPSQISWLLALVFFMAVLSVLYSIRGFTSRRTSGLSSGRIIPFNFRQLFSILIGYPSSWAYQAGDAVDQWHKVKNGGQAYQATSHLWFFHERYKTLDINALKNIRLFELRKANYEKLYAERIASGFLMLSVFAFIVWFLANFFLF